MQLNGPGRQHLPDEYFAEVSAEIDKLIVGYPARKNKFHEHIVKIILEAEKFGQYLRDKRDKFQKAKEAGRTQCAENKKKTGGWNPFLDDWHMGACVYFSDEECFSEIFGIEKKPISHPLGYLHGMIWGSIGQEYQGLVLVDYQFTLLAIIHDMQSWQAGRERIYFNAPLEGGGDLSDRLCRTVWHDLQECSSTDTQQTIQTAMLAVRANLEPQEKGGQGSGGKNEKTAGAWLWKLYETTLKVLVDAVLKRIWPKP